MITVKSFVDSTYYVTGSITVEVDGREYVITSENIGSEFTHVLHRTTFFVEDLGWDETRQLHYIDYGQDDENYDEDGNLTPEAAEFVNWFETAEELAAHKQMMVEETVNNSNELHNAILATVAQTLAAEKAQAEFDEKFGNGPIIIEPGFLTRLYERYSDDYSWESLLEERSGDTYEHVLYVRDNRCVVQELQRNKTVYTVMYVTRDECEPEQSYKTIDAALAALNEEVTAVNSPENG